ncbi:hypothetical protein KQX54_015358 [Cotesia glomerata]|uniref:Uncharacterized protein n=1 Tax=Cotesia glomerata TaxID=32391 RepID=A0AAV7J835_COTGL|nr:hypothetical protein KQX54_015358 [Cotesia glomerata]
MSGIKRKWAELNNENDSDMFDQRSAVEVTRKTVVNISAKDFIESIYSPKFEVSEEEIQENLVDEFADVDKDNKNKEYSAKYTDSILKLRKMFIKLCLSEKLQIKLQEFVKLVILHILNQY